PARSSARRIARAVSTRTRSRLYSSDPRRSAAGSLSAAAARAASRIVASSGLWPRRRLSARWALIGVGPTLVRPMPTRAHAPLSPRVSWTPTAAVAKSPTFRSSLSYAPPHPAPRRRRRERDPDLGGELAGGGGRREGTGEEPGDWNAAAALGPLGHDFRLEGEHHRRVVVGGIAVGEIAADGGEVPDEGVRDHPTCVGEDGKPPPHHVRCFELGLPDERADHERPVPLGDRPEPADPVQVDDVAGRGEPELHQGDETLATGEDLRVLAEPAEKGDRVLQGGRAVVLEGRRNHARPPSASDEGTGGDPNRCPILGA